MAFPFQTMVPTNSMARMIAVQTMYAHVPTFVASKCQTRGTRDMIIPIPAHGKNSMLVRSILVRWVEKRSEKRHEVFEAV